jgi:TRAP-type C4-dicarboxylate transport system permease small subunit
MSLPDVLTFPDAMLLAVLSGIFGGIVGGMVTVVFVRYVMSSSRKAARLVVAGEANVTQKES